MKLKWGVFDMKAGFIEVICLQTSIAMANILGEAQLEKICIESHPPSKFR
jgi:hypothetical protein